MEGITGLLQRYANGDSEALTALLPVVYAELSIMARRHMNRERAGHSLQPTALINEVYIRLVDQARQTWTNRAQFFYFASHLMRQILVDHARRRAASKRGTRVEHVTLEDVLETGVTSQPVDVIDLDRALAGLAAGDARKCSIVEMRYFGGMTVAEIAACLQVSESTINRDLRVALAWLHRSMRESSK